MTRYKPEDHNYEHDPYGDGGMRLATAASERDTRRHGNGVPIVRVVAIWVCMLTAAALIAGVIVMMTGCEFSYSSKPAEGTACQCEKETIGGVR